MTRRRGRFLIPDTKANKMQSAYYILSCLEQAGCPVDKERLKRLELWASAPNLLVFLAAPNPSRILRESLPAGVTLRADERRGMVFFEWEDA